MTTWLQRQEAIERRESYLAWRAGLLKRDLEAEKLGSDTELGDEEDNNEDGDESPNREPAGPTRADEVKVLRDLLHSNVTRAYSLPLTPSARRVSLDLLATSYGAVDVLAEINDYLDNNHPASPRATALMSIHRL